MTESPEDKAFREDVQTTMKSEIQHHLRIDMRIKDDQIYVSLKHRGHVINEVEASLWRYVGLVNK